MLGEFVGNALAEGGAVIDHRDVLHLHFLGRVQRHLGAELAVAGVDAEQVLVALLSDLRVRRHGGHQHAGIVVGARGRHRDARVVWTDDELDAVVDQLLRRADAGFRIALVVFRLQLELDDLAANTDRLRIQFLDREAGAVFIVLAGECLRTGQRSTVPDLDHGFLCGHRADDGK